MSYESSTLKRLDNWTEIIGPYMGSYKINRMIFFKIGKKTLEFAVDAKETEILRNKLNSKVLGQTVGILHSDSFETPLVVRVINGE